MIPEVANGDIIIVLNPASETAFVVWIDNTTGEEIHQWVGAHAHDSRT